MMMTIMMNKKMMMTKEEADHDDVCFFERKQDNSSSSRHSFSFDCGSKNLRELRENSIPVFTERHVQEFKSCHEPFLSKKHERLKMIMIRISNEPQIMKMMMTMMFLEIGISFQ